MTAPRRRVGVTAALACAAATACHTTPRGVSKDATVRTALSQALPALHGEHLRVTVVEVTYGPSGSSRPHRHPCAVIGYVVAGVYRSQVQGGSETIYRAGESFYEQPNGVHLVSANGSDTQPVRFIAYFTCDRDTPLSEVVE